MASHLKRQHRLPHIKSITLCLTKVQILTAGGHPVTRDAKTPSAERQGGQEHGCQLLLMDKNMHYIHHTCHLNTAAGLSVKIQLKIKAINQHILTQAHITPLQRAPSKLVRNLRLLEQRALIQLLSCNTGIPAARTISYPRRILGDSHASPDTPDKHFSGLIFPKVLL